MAWCAVPEICEHSRCNFSRVESAVAVQLNGALVLLHADTNCSILATSSYCFAEACSKTLGKLPRRIVRWVMIPNQRSTWFSQEA